MSSIETTYFYLFYHVKIFLKFFVGGRIFFATNYFENALGNGSTTYAISLGTYSPLHSYKTGSQKP